MTNAERQKRYRDRKRGGPPAGRWAGHTPVATLAKAFGSTRTMVFMSQWIIRHAPDEAPALEAGEAKTGPTYRRLRTQYIMALAEALAARPDRPGMRLVESRKAGRFVFRWVKAG